MNNIIKASITIKYLKKILNFKLKLLSPILDRTKGIAIPAARTIGREKILYALTHKPVSKSLKL